MCEEKELWFPILYRNFKSHAETDIEQMAINVSLQAFFVAVSDENACCKTKALSQPERDLAHAA